MSNRQDELERRVRETPLIGRLEKAWGMIGKMCSQGRPPKMRIPVQPDDEDFFMTTTIKDAIEELLAVAEMSAGLVYIPGDWLCPKCYYRLHQRILYAQTGAVGISDAAPEPCPNDGTPLERMTWKQDAEVANQIALDLVKQVRHLEARLYELEPRQ